MSLSLRMTAARLAILTACLISIAYAQTPPEKLEFEVASVKIAPPIEPGRPMRVGIDGGPGSNDPGRIGYANFGLPNLITVAYGINSYQLSGTEGIGNDRYNISAKLPAGTTREQLKVMLQNLLADRFKLVVHSEKKDAQVCTLVVAKNGPKLKESVETPPPPKDDEAAKPLDFKAPKRDADGYPILDSPGMIMEFGHARRRADKETMARLAGWLSGQMRQPVTDATGLTGKYDIVLSWIPGNGRSSLPSAAPPPGGGTPPIAVASDELGPDLQAALQQQLGLKVEMHKGTLDMIVVDHVNRVPMIVVDRLERMPVEN